MNARIVFWGIDGCGKTSNLQAIYAKLRPDHRGEMREVATPFDPTVSYEELPIELGEIAGVRTQIQLVAVPGGSEQAPTRKHILDEVDGIVLVLDSQRDRLDENVACVRELRRLLGDYGRSLDDVPHVVQYNKRDLSDPYALEELHRKLDLGSAAVFEAVASERTGVLETLSTISKRVIRSVRERGIASAPPPAPAPAEPATVVEAPVPTPPAQPTKASPGERMEEAILRESGHPELDAIDSAAQRAQSLLDTTWEKVSEEMERPAGFRIGADLSIVSVGEASRSGARAVRLPIVLGDGEGNTSSVVLTIQLDPLMDEN